MERYIFLGQWVHVLFSTKIISSESSILLIPTSVTNATKKWTSLEGFKTHSWYLPHPLAPNSARLVIVKDLLLHTTSHAPSTVPDWRPRVPCIEDKKIHMIVSWPVRLWQWWEVSRRWKDRLWLHNRVQRIQQHVETLCQECAEKKEEE